MLIMVYSLIYSPEENKYPVQCIHEKITGEPCPSCGMSHAFSLIVRGRIEEACQWNSLAIRLFLFFIIQMFMRIALAVTAKVKGHLPSPVAVIDAVVSSAMALFTFYPFLKYLWVILS